MGNERTLTSDEQKRVDDLREDARRAIDKVGEEVAYISRVTNPTYAANVTLASARAYLNSVAALADQLKGIESQLYEFGVYDTTSYPVGGWAISARDKVGAVSYTHLRAHET